jgi:hypothetical protein
MKQLTPKPRVLGRIPPLAPVLDGERRGESERLMAAERQEAPESSKEVESGQIKTPRLRGVMNSPKKRLSHRRLDPSPGNLSGCTVMAESIAGRRELLR